ncbi:MAG: hypothetical protein EB015_19220 [Methylocystaceae bacterium]|nr:hypothetical protein [Methylocystaceae bacterium]
MNPFVNTQYAKNLSNLRFVLIYLSNIYKCMVDKKGNFIICKMHSAHNMSYIPFIKNIFIIK